MEHWNSTLGSGFILLGILNNSGFPGLLGATVSVLYTLALTSNGLLLLVITMDARLHVSFKDKFSQYKKVVINLNTCKSTVANGGVLE